MVLWGAEATAKEALAEVGLVVDVWEVEREVEEAMEKGRMEEVASVGEVSVEAVLEGEGKEEEVAQDLGVGVEGQVGLVAEATEEVGGVAEEGVEVVLEGVVQEVEVWAAVASEGAVWAVEATEVAVWAVEVMVGVE